MSYTHIFSDHLLQKTHASPLLNEGYTLVWPSVFLIICLVILVIIRVTSLNKVIRLVQSCFSNQIWRQLEREEANLLKFYSVLLSTFFLLNLSFLLYKINDAYQLVLTNNSSLQQFLFILGITTGVILLKALFNWVLGFLTNDTRAIPEFAYSSFVVSQTLGLILFPCLVLSELSKLNPLIFLSASVVILGLGQLFKWYRGIMFGLVEHRVGFLQIFAYFCGLEILPVLVLVKFIIETF